MKYARKMVLILLCVSVCFVMAGCAESNKEAFNSTLEEYTGKIEAEAASAEEQFGAYEDGTALSTTTDLFISEVGTLEDYYTAGEKDLNAIDQLADKDAKILTKSLNSLKSAYKKAYEKVEKAYSKTF